MAIRIRKVFPAASVLLGAVLFIGGCGPKGPEVVEVTGTVTYQGKPVPNLFLNFKPEKGRPSWGVTDDQGRYWLRYSNSRDGAVTGSHTVWVQFRPKSPAEEFRMTAGGGGKSLLPAILEKYGNEATTPLKFEIAEKGQVVDIPLE